ncbi:transcriptional regulator, Sir2 family [Peptoanaerobacter stomatis]|uniref:NAD-dependent protein deacetylase n=1 Tax=Peptoanaerobacter stomatis TaxID=796937 RepID=J6H8J2_9FIRM|nr:NAD-dependent protein deacylase [Peptoanaerobacter stomatis]EJU21530.1 transcriptional regulator, Sir2 family [Peptoanaerobacter stomatis]NWO24707.1 NAD-dependent protein deacylase [Peptostreptococcaceae bacterium oral taxon 081]
MYEELKKVIDNSDNIVFFGGAGVSTESDIPDFRSSNGIFNAQKNITYSPETVVSHSFFMRNPEFFYQFYKDKMIYENARPNNAHKALAKLEQIGKLKAIITQNIDGLHQMAGSKNVLELHGTIHKNYCMKCNKNFDLDYIIKSENIPHCDVCGGIVRPDVVLYEESLDSDVLSESLHYISNADVLIIGGTSLIVYPAASLVNYFRGSKLVLINKSSTSQDSNADIVINDSIGKVLGDIVLL